MVDAAESETEEPETVPSRSRKVFHALSRLNGWSLVVVGVLSLAISAYSGGWAGMVISLALLLHGVYEIVLSKRSETGELKGPARRMALNQLGLATSLSLYFAYQMRVLDADVLMASLVKSPLYDALLLYPEDLRLQLLDSLPTILGAFYLVAAVVSWIFCGGTAVYYWSQGK